MPQNNPMSEIKTLLGFDAGYAIIKCKRVAWDNVENIVSQLIRSTLEASAERAKAWYIRTAGVEGMKSLEAAIMEPLTKEK